MTTQNKTIWRKVRLGEIVIPKGSVSGPFGSNIHSKFFNANGVPVIRGNNLAIGFKPSRYVDNNYIFLSEKKAEELSKSEALPEDIIVTARGTIGQTGIIPKHSRYKRYILSANQLRFRIDRKIANPLFVYYWLASKMMVRTMQNVSVNVGVPNLNLGNTRNLLVSLPPIPTQERIADILSAFDDKIELNNKISKNLEHAAQAIFKEWFIVSHKFSTKKGKLPKGWEIGVVKDMGRVVTGKTPSTKNPENFGMDYQFITIPDMRELFITNVKRYLSQKGFEGMKNLLLPPGSLCISCIATVGLVCITTRESFTNQQINSIIPNKDISRYYLYFLFKSLKRKLEAYGAGGTATLIVNKTQFENISIIIPGDEILENFHLKVKPLFDEFLLISQENQRLAALRDLLLPKLMSGEIRIKV